MSMSRYVLQPRWIPWHILCLVISVAFVRLGRWQWEVAVRTSPVDLQNAAYALQWFAFTGFVGFFWWRFMKDQRTVEQRDAERDEELID